MTSDSGTGLVHQAPGFGEDDFRVCLNFGIIRKGETVVCPVDASGKFTEEVSDFKGQYVKVRCVCVGGCVWCEGVYGVRVWCEVVCVV